MPQKKTIALTFDDGPNNSTTKEILDILEREHIVASFFLIGREINPETVRVVEREMSLGCEICCHSTAHAHMSVMTPEEIREDVNACILKIRDITGKEPAFFRPPYIDVSEAMFENIPMPFISGINCRDWEPAVGAEERVAMLRERVSDGCLVLLHDLAGNKATVEALRRIIPELKKQGYRFMTASEIFQHSGVDPHQHKLWSNVYQTGYQYV